MKSYLQGLSFLLFSFIVTNYTYAGGPGNLPALNKGLVFNENKGQILDQHDSQRPDILFKGRTGPADVYVRKTGVSYVICNERNLKNEARDAVEERVKKGSLSPNEMQSIKRDFLSQQTVKLQRVDLDFANSNPHAEFITENRLSGFSNYFYSHCPNGITNVPSYGSLTVKNMYPNIDVKYSSGSGIGLKYDLVVNPGGKPSDIKLIYSRAD